MARNSKINPSPIRSNFYYSFFFLPKEKRIAITRVYRFCRAVDDIADNPLPRYEKVKQIHEWRHELKRCYDGNPTHPITQALYSSIQTFGLSRSYFEDLIRGVEMDLNINRYESFDDLSEYCYYVAGTVGLLCLQIFGLPIDKYRNYGIPLATAFQLTNILRDLKSDASRGRIYLPLEDLQKFGYSENELLTGIYNKKFIALMEYEADRAAQFYTRARKSLKPGDRKNLVASEIMAAIYSSLLQKIRAAKYSVYSRQLSLSNIQKAWIAIETWLSIRLARHRT